MKGMNMGGMMKQAQDMQRKMSEVQGELEQRVIEASSGGGMVTVQVNGAQEVLSVKINPEVVDPEDVDMLEDLVLAAVSQGLKDSRDMVQSEMSKITGGLNIPGLF